MGQAKATSAVLDNMAAMIRLQPLLREKKRGDWLLYSEVEEYAQIDDARTLRRLLKTWFINNAGGVELVAEPNKGWRLPTSNEQAQDVAGAREKKGHRQFKRALRATVLTDDSDLSPEVRALKAHKLKHYKTHLAAQEIADQQARAILGAPQARPQLKPVK